MPGLGQDPAGPGRHTPACGRGNQPADAVAFEHLDRDGDGTLSGEEFVSAIVEFRSSSDPAAPGNWWTVDPSFGTAR
ncbi:EF-hand domain-containing protein [Kitasatospora kazusensis]|uniref:EF-hand domain-containing protein n=1 Tax=Kitasatospora kazusensis TaxID=407974 RepID=UPI0031D93519